MTTGTLDIVVYCGRDFYLNLNNTTAAGNPFNMTGYSTVMTVKANINDPDSRALYQGGPWANSSLAFGDLTFKIPHTVTAGWWVAPPSGSGAISTVAVYDVAYADASGPPKNWNTMLTGSVALVQSVTVVIPGG
jgi:hypothetical protein